jgi:hypothetical protein
MFPLTFLWNLEFLIFDGNKKHFDWRCDDQKKEILTINLMKLWLTILIKLKTFSSGKSFSITFKFIFMFARSPCLTTLILFYDSVHFYFWLPFFKWRAAQNKMAFRTLKIPIKCKYESISRVIFTIIFELHADEFTTQWARFCLLRKVNDSCLILVRWVRISF